MQKPTASQLWVAHSLEALATGAAVTAAINVYTAFQAGNLTLSAAAVIAATALGAVLSKGIASLLTNPQTLQAGQDTLSELKDATVALINSHQNVLDALTTQVVATPQPASVPPQSIVPNAPIPSQGTMPVISPGFAQPTGQPLYMPNLSITATAAPPSFVQPWNPPSSDFHAGDTGIVPVVPQS